MTIERRPGSDLDSACQAPVTSFTSSCPHWTFGSSLMVKEGSEALLCPQQPWHQLEDLSLSRVSLLNGRELTQRHGSIRHYVSPTPVIYT